MLKAGWVFAVFVLLAVAAWAFIAGQAVGVHVADMVCTRQASVTELALYEWAHRTNQPLSEDRP